MALIDARQYVTNPSGWKKVPKADIIGKAAHHSVSGTFFMATETTVEDEVNHIRIIDEYHVRTKLGGFAYHTCAFPSGRAYQTGDFDGARAHTWGRNEELLGWVLVGDYSNQLPSAGGMAAAAECERAFDAYLRREVPLRGHRDWAFAGYGTTCPGRVRERLTTIRNLARKEDDMDEAEVRAIARDEMMKMEFAAYDGDAPKSGKRNLVTWAWSLIRHEQTLHEVGAEPHDHNFTVEITGKTT